MFGGKLVSRDSESASGSAHAAIFFKTLGRRLRELRKNAGYTLGEMASFGFSVRHWQQIEAGRPITVTTMPGISEVLEIKLEDVLHGFNQDNHPDRS